MLDPVTEPEVVEEPAVEGESLRGFPGENRFADSPGAEDLVEDELLVEDVSIDGMCGVY